MPKSSPRSVPAAPEGPGAPEGEGPQNPPRPRDAARTATSGPPADDLSFREAQTALELCLAQLQDQELDVESMADLYRRAQHYADRCEAVLNQVEQEVMQWDPVEQDPSPTPYAP